MPLLEPPARSNRPRGFRIERVELLNWGTLGDDVIHVADVRGEWLCITGRNGTGKSTMVDGITTAFPPANARIYYNAAGGAKDSKERTRLTYLRGVFGSQQDEKTGRAVPAMLRSKAFTPSAILVQFYDAYSENWATLMVLGTVDGQNQEKWLYGTFAGKADLGIIQGREDWDSRAKRLRKSGWSLTAEPGDYRERLIGMLKIPSEKALKTFVRTVGLKDIGDVNAFIRGHMLEEVSIHERYVELTKHYAKCIEIDAEIQRTKEMIGLLTPLDTFYPALKEVQRQLAEKKNVEEAVSWRIADEAAGLIESLCGKIQTELDEINGTRTGIESEIHAKQAELDIQLKSEPALRAAELTRRAAELAAQRREVDARAKELSVTLQNLKLPMPTSEKTFQSMRASLQEIIQKADEAEELQNDELAGRKLAVRDLATQIAAIDTEIETLRRATSHLPSSYLKLRAEIADACGLKEADLPYVGELVDVDPAQAQWRVALEKLLRTFARRILVPAANFPQVARYVNETTFAGRRVRLARVPLKPARFTMGALADNAAARKLRVKHSSPHADWLRNTIEMDFDHRCFDDVDAYERCMTTAVTLTGLTKGKRQEFHDKFDDIEIRDARDYYLGWDNQEKVRGLLEERRLLEARHTDAVTLVNRQREQNTSAKTSRDLAKLILNSLKSFDEINLGAVNGNLAALAHQRRELEAADPDAAAAESRIAELQSQLDTLRQKEKTDFGLSKTLEERKKRLNQDLHEHEEQRPTAAPTAVHADTASAFFKDALPEDSTGLPKWANRVRSRFGQHYVSLTTRENDLKLDIKGVMTGYLSRFPTEAKNLQDSMDAVPDFVARKTELEAEKLVELQTRFRENIRDNLALHVSTLKAGLAAQLKDIEERLEAINTILLDIPFENGFPVEICPRKNGQPEIIEFERLVSEASAPLLNPSQDQSLTAFDAVKSLLGFLENENTRKLVLDARNWKLFGVRFGEEFKESTNGLSGGQKNKLSVTLLASALAYQYDLVGPNRSLGTFRTVIIDEAFARLDSENARFALELFKKFDFQLILVHPLDGTVRIAEEYVGSFLFATIRDNRHSALTPLRIEQLQAEVAATEALG